MSCMAEYQILNPDFFSRKTQISHTINRKLLELDGQELDLPDSILVLLNGIYHWVVIFIECRDFK